MTSIKDLADFIKTDDYIDCEYLENVDDVVDESFNKQCVQKQNNLSTSAFEITNFDTQQQIEDDPLAEEKIDISSKLKFETLFNDNDVLAQQNTTNDANNSIDKETFKTARRLLTNRNKRARLQTDYKSSDGTIWSSINKIDEKPLDNFDESTTTSEITHKPKGKGPARIVSSVLEAWHLMFDEPILMTIVKETNAEIRRRRTKVNKQRSTDLIELRAWIGLNYLCGLFRNHTHTGPLDELWTQELGNIVFRATMSVKRFQFLNECIRFAEVKLSKTTKTTAKTTTTTTDALQLISYIWEKFVINCRSYYSPSKYCSIDELIMCTNDKNCPYHFSLTNASQTTTTTTTTTRNGKGLRLVILCDAQTLYMCNILLVTEPVAIPREIFQLISDIKGTKRHVTLSEKYTTLQIAQKLQQQQLSLTGAIQMDAKEIPKYLTAITTTSATTTATQTTIQTTDKFYNGNAILIVDHNNSTTKCLLTNDLSEQIDGKKLFNLTHKACEQFQQLSQIYSTNGASTKDYQNWTLDILHTMLDYGAFNAWILLRLSEKGDAHIKQRDFLRQLGLYLTQQQLKRRLHMQKLSLIQRLQISELLGEQTDRILRETVANATSSIDAGVISNEKLPLPNGIVLMSRYIEKRVRCRKCKDNKVRTRCQQCLKPLCIKHLVMRCCLCTGISEECEKNFGT